MPEIVGDESVGVKYAINGLISLTPDGMPILGETPEVKGLWSAAAVWVKEGPGVGKSVAEWMVHGESEIDLHSSDIARFHAHQTTRAHVRARTGEAFNKTYGIVHPAEQWASDRDLRLSPMHQRHQALGAVFFEAVGWERPQWFESNAPLLEEYGDRVTRREAEWESRWWSPIINAEHLALRERVGMVDLAAFAIFDVTGPGALDYLQGLVVSQMDVPVGRVVYTPLLSEAGGIVADLTIIRLGRDRFRVVTGGGMGMRDKKWFNDHLPADGSVQLQDQTSALYTLGVAFVRFVVETISLHNWSPGHYPVVLGAAYVVWLFVWFAYPWSMSGKSLGMAELGPQTPPPPKPRPMTWLKLPKASLRSSRAAEGLDAARDSAIVPWA